MATTVTCDRCGRVINPDFDRTHEVGIRFGPSEEGAFNKDLCIECIGQLITFFDRQPSEA